LLLAEYHFNNKEFAKALALYQRLGKFPKSAVYGYSFFQQGWCWLNLQKPKEALEKFVMVIRDAPKWGNSAKRSIVLVKEAKKGAVRAYSQVGSPRLAWLFFRKISG
ncbi:MAG: tetratricopeptide repeat protein, partial [Deltaproteobacteria bacterium]|nr:tetratricopeptide repeat protein [Deltaproteobacteria bacterium]